VPPKIHEAHAAVGDIGIWNDTSGDSFPGTVGTWVKATFENQALNESSHYTKDAQHDDFDLGEAGNYLVLYYLRARATHNNRVAVQTRVTLNGTAVAGSYGYSYLRDTANDEVYARGGRTHPQCRKHRRHCC